MIGLGEGAQIPKSGPGGAEPRNGPIRSDLNKKVIGLGEGAQIPKSGPGGAEPGNGPIRYDF